MTGFEPLTSGIGSDRSTNWATTTAQSNKDFGQHFASNQILRAFDLIKLFALRPPWGSRPCLRGRQIKKFEYSIFAYKSENNLHYATFDQRPLRSLIY